MKLALIIEKNIPMDIVKKARDFTPSNRENEQSESVGLLPSEKRKYLPL